MSDRWCDDCAWPEECTEEFCCRRREAGEIRSAAPSETAAKIERSLPGVIVLNGVTTKERTLQLARLRMLTPVERGDVFGWQP